jgi:hypothetical protein
MIRRKVEDWRFIYLYGQNLRLNGMVFPFIVHYNRKNDFGKEICSYERCTSEIDLLTRWDLPNYQLKHGIPRMKCHVTTTGST